MKFEIIIDKFINEKVLKLFTNEIDDEVKKIEMLIQGSNINKIVGLDGDNVVILDHGEIYRIYSESKKIYIKTKEKEYISKLNLQEVEAQFKGNNFIQISRSEIINLDYVKRLDLSFKGTIAVEMKNGDISYLSRRRMTNFKKVLGI